MQCSAVQCRQAEVGKKEYSTLRRGTGRRSSVVVLETVGTWHPVVVWKNFCPIYKQII